MPNPKIKHKDYHQKKKNKGDILQKKSSFFHQHFLIILISLSLFVATLVIFGQLKNYDFINLDDDAYVTDNSSVIAGLTFQGAIWAFTTMHASNWHPLTWLSHMLDYELYGLRPGGHHLTNLLFHIANTLLLFLLFKRMTGSLWRSSFIAALFAFHPLHVESVAWIAERKDVLSTLFLMLIMWAYVRYVERPQFIRYVPVLLFFALGLMSKPMLVTLPFVLLLLDYWPLGRFQFGRSEETPYPFSWGSINLIGLKTPLRSLVLEKIPFFALTTISSFLTVIAQQRGGAVKSIEYLPIEIRIVNALVSYVHYLFKMIWPQDLAVLYPYPPPDTLSLWKVLGAAFLLIGVSLFVIRTARRHPYLLVGWFWYLGTLVPAIGLVQVGMQAMADRYTYVPLIGLFIMIAGGVPDILISWRHRKIVLAISGGIILSIFIIITRLQIQHWQNSITLCEHTLSVTRDNFLIRNNLGNALFDKRKVEEAISHYLEALRIKPDHPEVHNNLGVALAAQGKMDEAIHHYRKALRIAPNYARVHNNLGNALFPQGKVEEAISHYLKALTIKPDYAVVHSNLGVAYAHLGKDQEAIAHFKEAIQIEPNNAKICYNLGFLLARQGKVQEAIGRYKEALRIKPDLPEAHFSLGLAFLKIGNRGLALEEYEILKRINPDLAIILFHKIFK